MRIIRAEELLVFVCSIKLIYGHGESTTAITAGCRGSGQRRERFAIRKDNAPETFNY